MVFPGLEDIKEGDGEVDKVLLESLGQEVSSEWSWVWKESAEDDRKQALTILEGLVE